MLPLFADEPTRALVAMEMMFTDNYWVPTIQGEHYYNKPPFYNWIVAGVFHLTGSMSEFVFRLPSVIPLLLFGLTIYFWTKKHLSRSAAFLSAGLFVTCGRILTYASLLGHIDIFYSWLVFISFIVFVESLQSKNWWKFFVLTYALAIITFLCKGLPTVVFQGLTMIVLLIYSKNFKKFFSVQHLVGILIFSLFVSGYFYMYAQHNSLEGWASIMWEQSAQRTIIDKAWYESLIHIFKFPVEHLYHLAPWSLFVIFLFKKDVRRKIWQNEFLKLLSLILIVNVPVYWLSPGYYPRYLFMLYPIIFILLAQGYFVSENERAKKILRYIFLGFAALMIIGAMVLPFLSLDLGFSILKGVIVVLLALISIGALIYLKQHKYVGFILVLLTFKLAFSWSGVPARLKSGRTFEYKTEAVALAKQTTDERLKLLRWSAINQQSAFYIQRERKEILWHTEGVWPDAYHLVAEKWIDKHNFEKLDSMTIKFGNRELYLVKTD